MHPPIELGHGRIDTRGVRLIPVTPAQVNFPGIYSVIEIKRDSICKKTDEHTRGRRIYLGSRPDVPPAEHLGNSRLRWNIENKNHHPRDATLLEDKCRCRTRNTAANLALLRGVVLTLWKITHPGLPATAFISQNQRKLDDMFAIFKENQRLTDMK